MNKIIQINSEDLYKMLEETFLDGYNKGLKKGEEVGLLKGKIEGLENALKSAKNLFCINK